MVEQWYVGCAFFAGMMIPVMVALIAMAWLKIRIYNKECGRQNDEDY